MYTLHLCWCHKVRDCTIYSTSSPLQLYKPYEERARFSHCCPFQPGKKPNTHASFEPGHAHWVETKINVILWWFDGEQCASLVFNLAHQAQGKMRNKHTRVLPHISPSSPPYSLSLPVSQAREVRIEQLSGCMYVCACMYGMCVWDVFGIYMSMQTSLSLSCPAGYAADTKRNTHA